MVAAAGLMAATLILALPRLAATDRFLRFRLGGWLSPRTTSRRLASQAWALVSACWLVRAVAFFLLFGGLGIGFSVPLALLFLCAGAAAAALAHARITCTQARLKAQREANPRRPTKASTSPLGSYRTTTWAARHSPQFRQIMAPTAGSAAGHRIEGMLPRPAAAQATCSVSRAQAEQ